MRKSDGDERVSATGVGVDWGWRRRLKGFESQGKSINKDSDRQAKIIVREQQGRIIDNNKERQVGMELRPKKKGAKAEGCERSEPPRKSVCECFVLARVFSGRFVARCHIQWKGTDGMDGDTGGNDQYNGPVSLPGAKGKRQMRSPRSVIGQTTTELRGTLELRGQWGRSLLFFLFFSGLVWTRRGKVGWRVH